MVFILLLSQGVSPMMLFSLIGGGLIILGLVAAAIALMQKMSPHLPSPKRVLFVNIRVKKLFPFLRTFLMFISFQWAEPAIQVL